MMKQVKPLKVREPKEASPCIQAMKRSSKQINHSPKSELGVA